MASLLGNTRELGEARRGGGKGREQRGGGERRTDWTSGSSGITWDILFGLVNTDEQHRFQVRIPGLVPGLGFAVQGLDIRVGVRGTGKGLQFT